MIGVTPSQSARYTLAAGVPVSYNAAQFLGHLPGRRGARGPVPIGPGTLLVVDEASMLSGPDLADLIAYAKARGAKIIFIGDITQLQAVENDGGMSLLAARLGYARLAEPVRFRSQWEQQASLRLRDRSAPRCGREDNARSAQIASIRITSAVRVRWGAMARPISASAAPETSMPGIRGSVSPSRRGSRVPGVASLTR